MIPKKSFDNITNSNYNYKIKGCVDEQFLKENNINISKITYSYKFPYNYEYKSQERGSAPNKARHDFLQSIYHRLLKLHNENNMILDRPNYIIEMKYLYKTKYYNININNERIIFNNIDFENTGELEIIVLNLIGYDLLEMGKYEHHNIVYKVDFGSCYINKTIKKFNYENMDKFEQLNTNDYAFIDSKKGWVNVHGILNSNHVEFKINLKGRNKWLIHHNTKNRNDGSINDMYKYVKSNTILPNLLKYLQTDRYSLFSYLFPEIIDIIIDILKITIQSCDNSSYPSPSYLKILFG